ncbi:hypothetical protein BGZ60DRAFT_227525 [Tricladium varicosporioides]|nr:hypothetical protein BGZ60DRAFT_227525 [Hymenoscyphus varicosporioides]
MFPDPSCALLSIYYFYRTFLELQGHAREWEGYEDLLNRISDLISDLESDRHRTSRKLISGGWGTARSEIEAARSTLERAQRQVIWRYENQGYAMHTISMSRKRDRVNFVLNYKTIMKNYHLLMRYEDRLLRLRSELGRVEEKLPVWEIPRRCAMDKTFREMKKQSVGQMTMFMGKGEWSSNCEQFLKQPSSLNENV